MQVANTYRLCCYIACNISLLHWALKIQYVPPEQEIHQ